MATATDLRSPARKTVNWGLARHLKNHLTIFPPDVREVAFATCRIQVMGWDQGNHNGEAGRASRKDLKKGIQRGRWVYTRIQTYGKKPFTNKERWRKQGDRTKWIDANSFDAANDVLACFGLSMTDVLEAYGDVERHDRIQLDLTDIVAKLKPQLLPLPFVATSTATPDDDE